MEELTAIFNAIIKYIQHNPSTAPYLLLAALGIYYLKKIIINTLKETKDSIEEIKTHLNSKFEDVNNTLNNFKERLASIETTIKYISSTEDDISSVFYKLSRSKQTALDMVCKALSKEEYMFIKYKVEKFIDTIYTVLTTNPKINKYQLEDDEYKIIAENIKYIVDDIYKYGKTILPEDLIDKYKQIHNVATLKFMNDLESILTKDIMNNRVLRIGKLADTFLFTFVNEWLNLCIQYNKENNIEVEEHKKEI